MPKLKGCWNPVIQGYEFAKIYMGLNCILEEGTEMKELLKISIPFMRHHHGFVRYKKFIPSPSYSDYKIKTDQEIKRIKILKNNHKDEMLVQYILEAVLNSLEYIQKGQYNPNRRP